MEKELTAAAGIGPPNFLTIRQLHQQYCHHHVPLNLIKSLLAPSLENATYQPVILLFTAIPSLQDLAIFMATHGRAHSSGQYSRGPLCSSCQQAVWNTVQTFPNPESLERVLPTICSAYILPQQSPTFVFVRRTWSSQTVSGN